MIYKVRISLSIKKILCFLKDSEQVKNKVYI
jgi:hypothetical protein